MTKKLVWFAMAVMTTLLALAALWQFRTVVVIVLISLALAASVRPLARWWSRHGLAVRISLILLFLLLLAGSGYLLILGGGAAIGEVRLLADSVAVQDEWMLPDWLQGTFVQQSVVARLPSPSRLFAAVTGDQGQLVVPAILGFTRGIAGLASGVFVVLFLSLYWSLNQGHFERLWLSLLPPGQRTRTRMIWHTIEADLGAYIRSQIVQSLLAGLLLGLGYWALGSPYPALLALAGALGSLIPMVGGGLAILLALLVGLLSSLQLSVLTTLYTLVILAALEIWIKPRLFNHRQYNPILTVVILIGMANAFGLIGLIAAPPLSAAIQILWSRVVIHRVAAGSASQFSDLQDRQAWLAASIQALNEPPAPLVTSSMERLAGLLAAAQVVLEGEPSPEGSLPDLPQLAETNTPLPADAPGEPCG